MSHTVIWWMRRDLRLTDNAALRAAIDAAGAEGMLLPLFILDEALLRRTPAIRRDFLFAGLRALDADLRKLGSHLVIRGGNPLAVLQAVCLDCGADAVFAAEDYSPYARRRDAAVAEMLQLHLVLDVSIQHPIMVCKADGMPYTVFTPFRKRWDGLPQASPQPAPAALPPVPALAGDPLPDEPHAPGAFTAGEAEAQRRLNAFLDSPIFMYADGRNRLDMDGTSSLSPYLHFGMLSPRQAVAAANAAQNASPDELGRKGCAAWRNELVWREFYLAILYHFPSVLQRAFRPGFREIPWRIDAVGLRAWQSGLTGVPVVDACMRQLNATGWMHNRGRMIAASFLVKDLLIDWRLGEDYFFRKLIDGDSASNNGGWQWVAGVGTDAAPYFRIFNPLLQARKFDPHGDFVRRWVPELAHLPGDRIHMPWLWGGAPGYPPPVVDHEAVRGRTLQAYRGN